MPQTKLYIGFGTIVAIILLLLVLAYNNFAHVADAIKWDRQTLDVLIETDRIATNVLEIQNATRGFMLTGEQRFLSPETDEVALLDANISRTIVLTRDNPAQNARARKIEALTSAWLMDVINPLIAKRRALGKSPNAADQVARAPEVGNGFQTVSQVRKLIDEMAVEESRLLAERSAASAELQRTMFLLLSVGGVVCIVLATGISITLTRALVAPLNNLTRVVGQIAAGHQSARAAVLSRDELGKVTEEFNRMAQAIQDSQANELAATNELRAKVDALLDVVSKAAIGDLTGSVTISGSDAIGRMGDGLRTMVENLRKLLNNVQKAGIQVTTSATEIAASAKQQEATGIEQAQTSIEILTTTKEISSNTAQLLKTMEDATAVADYTTTATADAQCRQTRGRHDPAGSAAPGRHAEHRDQRRRPRRRPGTHPRPRHRAQDGQRADGASAVAARAAGVPVPARVQPEGERQRDLGPRDRARYRAADHPRTERHGAHRIGSGRRLSHLDHAAADPVDRARAGVRGAGRGLRDPDRRAEDRARGMSAGADYYLTKGSFHDETLLDAVFDLIGEASA